MIGRRDRARLADLERRVARLEQDSLAPDLARLRAALDELGLPFDLDDGGDVAQPWRGDE